jgi:hypothetical protein
LKNKWITIAAKEPGSRLTLGFPAGNNYGNFGFSIFDFGVLFQLVLNLIEVYIDSQAKLR